MVIPVDFAAVCANPQAALALWVAASLIALTLDVSFVSEINRRCVSGDVRTQMLQLGYATIGDSRAGKRAQNVGN